MKALRDLDKAAYAAITAGRDTTRYPMLNRLMLRQIAAMSSSLVDAGIDETADDPTEA